MTSVPDNTVLAYHQHASSNNLSSNNRNRLIEFGGDEGEDYRHFEKRLESYFALSDINNDKRKIIILQTQLQHSARAFFDDLIAATSNEKQCTYTFVADAMRKEYITPQLIRRYQLAFNAMYQGHEEPPRVYLGRLKEAAKLANITTPALIEMRFQTGLHPDIITQCRLIGAESFEDCVKCADGYWNAYHQKSITIVDNPFVARPITNNIVPMQNMNRHIYAANLPVTQNHMFNMNNVVSNIPTTIPTAVSTMPTAVPTIPTVIPTTVPAPVVPVPESPTIKILSDQLRELQLNHMESNPKANLDDDKLQAMIDESIKRHLAATKSSGYSNNNNNNYNNNDRRGRYNNESSYRNNDNYRNNNDNYRKNDGYNNNNYRNNQNDGYRGRNNDGYKNDNYRNNNGNSNYNNNNNNNNANNNNNNTGRNESQNYDNRNKQQYSDDARNGDNQEQSKN